MEKALLSIDYVNYITQIQSVRYTIRNLMPPNQTYSLVTILVDNGHYALTPPFQITMAISFELQTQMITW